MTIDPPSDTTDRDSAGFLIPVEFAGPESLVTALSKDPAFTAIVRGDVSLDRDPDVATHAFNLEHAASIAVIVHTSLVILAPLLRRLITGKPSTSLYIRTPKAEIMLDSSAAENIKALEEVLKALQ